MDDEDKKREQGECLSFTAAASSVFLSCFRFIFFFVLSFQVCVAFFDPFLSAERRIYLKINI